MEEILSYEDFKEELKQRIQEQADGYSAVERRIEINNGVYQEKLICESKDDNLVPAVPLKTLYSVYLQIGMEALVEMVVKIFTYRYQVDKTDSGVNVVLSGSFAGTQTVTVSYTVSDTYTTDSDGEGEVYQLGLLSSRWARAVGSCSFQVILPQPSGTMPEDYTLTPAVLSGYYGELAES